jgi:hypothetical protein
LDWGFEMKLRVSTNRPLATALDEKIDAEARAARVVHAAFVCLSDNELKCFFMSVAGLNYTQQARAMETTPKYTSGVGRAVTLKLRARVNYDRG